MKRAIGARLFLAGIAVAMAAAYGLVSLAPDEARAGSGQSGQHGMPWVYINCGTGGVERVYQEPADFVPWLTVYVGAPGRCD